MIKFTRLLIVIILVLISTHGKVEAATLKTTGLSVSPAIEQINLANHQTTATFSSQVTNDTKYPVTVIVSVDDFTALNNSGGVAFINNNSLVDNSHGLAKSMVPAYTQFALGPGETQTIPVSIDATNLAPGGHYGAILYKVIPTQLASRKNAISSNEEISSLVFLTTFNNGSQIVKLDKPSTRSLYFKMPTSIDLVFMNTGNTQTSPRGIVKVLNSKNKEIGRGIINIDSGLVLPDTSRLYVVSLRNEVGHVYPGTYHFQVSYRADNALTSTIYSKNFYFINQPIIILVSIGLLGFIFFIIRRSGRSAIFQY
jgi:hypothetical protein